MTPAQRRNIEATIWTISKTIPWWEKNNCPVSAERGRRKILELKARLKEST